MFDCVFLKLMVFCGSMLILLVVVKKILGLGLFLFNELGLIIVVKYVCMFNFFKIRGVFFEVEVMV